LDLQERREIAMSALRRGPAMVDVQEQQIKRYCQSIAALDQTLENLGQILDQAQSRQSRPKPASLDPFAPLEWLVDKCLQGLEWAAHKLACRIFP
jgi:hypothetical protein